MHITIEEAKQQLIAGQVVAVPTETVYGLAADASNPAAIKKIFATKQRPKHNPLIVHIADQSAVLDWASDYPELAQRLAKAFWPGPLTLVLKAAPTVPPIVTANQTTVALRVPNHPVMLSLLKDSGLGLAAPSANKYTQVSPTRSEHVMSGLGVHLAVVDGGPCQVGLESTIVEVYADAAGNTQWQLLRAGMISAQSVQQAAQQAPVEKTKKAVAPGQHHLHYSPATPIQLCDSSTALTALATTLRQQSKKVAEIRIGVINQSHDYQTQILADLPEDYAKGFYHALHQLDQLGMDVILIESPPKTNAWSAVHDRLSRAASQAQG